MNYLFIIPKYLLTNSLFEFYSISFIFYLFVFYYLEFISE